MIKTLELILEKSLEKLSYQVTTYLPPLLVAAGVLVTSYLLAIVVRALLLKAIKGATLERFLKESGVSSLIDYSGRSGKLRGPRLAASAAYWIILIAGALASINAFDTRLTSQIVEAAVLLLPKLVTAAIILLAGFWLAQYLGRSTLVWTCNEGLPHPRRWALVVRIVIIFGGIVVAADTLQFAERVFLSGFLVLVGGAALAGALALGLGARESVQRFLQTKDSDAADRERSVWSHL